MVRGNWSFVEKTRLPVDNLGGIASENVVNCHWNREGIHARQEVGTRGVTPGGFVGRNETVSTLEQQIVSGGLVVGSRVHVSNDNVDTGINKVFDLVGLEGTIHQRSKGLENRKEKVEG